MDVDQIIVDALKYPTLNWGKVFTLGAFIIVPFLILFGALLLGGFINNLAITLLFIILGLIILILAMIAIYGYLFRVIKASLADINELPNFDDWGGMLVDGVKILVVNIIYGLLFGLISLIPLGIMFLAIILLGAPFYGISSVSDPANFLGAGFAFWVFYLLYFIVYLILILLMLLATILVPVAIANMAYRDDFGAAFNFSELRKKIESIRWGKAIVWAIAIYFVITLATIVAMITGLLVIGIILVPLLIIPFMAIFYARSIALLYLNE